MANHGEVTERHRRLMTRRNIVLGACAAGAVAIAANIGKPRRAICYLFPASHQGSGETPGVAGREGIFTNPPFRECHASTLAAVGTTLVSAWFGGSYEGHPDTAIWFSRRDQTGWSKPRMLADGGNGAGETLPCWNPVLWHGPGGRLHLFYKVGETPRSWRGMAMESGNGGQSWNAPASLPDGILGPIKNKPVLLADGRLLCPSSTEHDGWRVHFEWTPDQGRSWQRTPPIGDGNTPEIIQPTLLVHAGGRLQALCRSRQGFIAETWSEDGGRSWSAPRLTDLPNPNSGIDGLTLSDGRHLLVHNPVPRCRSPLVVSLSEDGRDWREIATLDSRRGEFSYPAIIQDGDGAVRISYTDRRREITVATIDPGKI